MGWVLLLGLFVIVIVAVMFLKGFDRVSGRGPGQISKGMKEYDDSRDKK